jgi:hypothetical protein
MSRFKQFFEDDNGRLSMARLLVFGAFIVSTPVLLWQHSVEAMSVFLGAFVTQYGIAKTTETIAKKGADNANQP